MLYPLLLASIAVLFSVSRGVAANASVAFIPIM